MTDKPRMELGAIILEETHTQPAGPPALVASLAKKYGASAQSLIDEIEGSTTLAKIARDLLGWPERSQPKRGRPAKLDKNWSTFVFIELYRQELGSKAAAVRKFVQLSGESDDEGALERVDKVHRRALRDWGEGSAPRSIAAMFAPPPPKLKGRKES